MLFLASLSSSMMSSLRIDRLRGSSNSLLRQVLISQAISVPIVTIIKSITKSNRQEID